MMPNITRGGNTTGLMMYLVGPGRANEHENPHLIAHGEDQIIRNIDGTLSAEDATSIASELDTYMNFHEVFPQGNVIQYDYETDTRYLIERTPNHVWHCSLSLAPDEPALSDEQWAEIAHDFMTHMGFTDPGKAPARWVAVHHGTSKAGGDHIHIVANIVRTDGTRVNVHNDYKRSQETCNKLEHKYGLAIVEGREHGRGSINDSAKALNDAAKKGQRLTDRARLETRVRAAATAAQSEADFVNLVKQTGVRIRPYFAKGTTDVITGYAVALHTPNDVKPQWYGGGRLARDLALPRLRQRWDDTPLKAMDAAKAWRDAWKGTDYKPSGKPASWRARLDAVEQVRERISQTDYTNPTALADLTQDIAGIYSAAATKHAGTHLGRAFDRAARQLGRAAQTKSRPHVANPTDPATRMVTTALLMYASQDPDMRQIIVMHQAMRLVQELAALYEQAKQTRTAQVLLRDTQEAYAHLTRRIDTTELTDALSAKREELTRTNVAVIERDDQLPPTHSGDSRRNASPKCPTRKPTAQTSCRYRRDWYSPTPARKTHARPHFVVRALST
ncbi:MAG: relaxase/mobilization nuclease domain-containing protein [Actinomycetaceae bacterium]|nr:relaxase/mobilization nuclease domain-containing protein [Actinomycetaceae bacterium]